jgi:hypothetical protein
LVSFADIEADPDLKTAIDKLEKSLGSIKRQSAEACKASQIRGLEEYARDLEPYVYVDQVEPFVETLKKSSESPCIPLKEMHHFHDVVNQGFVKRMLSDWDIPDEDALWEILKENNLANEICGYMLNYELIPQHLAWGDQGARGILHRRCIALNEDFMNRFSKRWRSHPFFSTQKGKDTLEWISKYPLDLGRKHEIHKHFMEQYPTDLELSENSIVISGADYDRFVHLLLKQHFKIDIPLGGVLHARSVQSIFIILTPVEDSFNVTMIDARLTEGNDAPTFARNTIMLSGPDAVKLREQINVESKYVGYYGRNQ